MSRRQRQAVHLANSLINDMRVIMRRQKLKRYVILAALLAFVITTVLFFELGSSGTFGGVDHVRKGFYSRGSGHAKTGSPPPQANVDKYAGKPRLRLPVWWFAPFLDSSSFGQEATTLIMSLAQSKLIAQEDLWISLLQMDCKDQMADVLDPGVHEELLAMKARATTSRKSVVVCHNMPKFYGKPTPAWASCAPCPPPGSSSYAIARAMAETDKFPADFVSSCNSMDEVWVPSSFSEDVLAKSGVDRSKIKVVPIAINTTFFDPLIHEPIDYETLPMEQVFGLHERSPGKMLTLLSVFKWEGRKGWDALLQAYLSEFTFKDRIRLVILTKPFANGNDDIKGMMENWLNQHSHRRNVMLPRVFIIQEQLDAVTYARLLRTVDAFVLPTRGEGWGLPMVEAMSMAKPVIATNWSGVTAYLDDRVGYPIPYTLADVPDSEPSWFKGSHWAEPDQGSLRTSMRAVLAHPKEAALRGQAARERMLDRYSPQALSVTLFHEFRRIERKLRVGIGSDLNQQQ